MRFKYLLIPMVLLLTANSFAAESEMVGMGVFAGDADEINEIYKLKNSRASDSRFGGAATGDNGYQIYGDYLFYQPDFIEVPEGKGPLYFGGGAQNITYSEYDGKNKGDKFGLRFPVANEYLFWKSSTDAFLELSPVLSSTPDTKFQFGGGIGIKFLF